MSYIDALFDREHDRIHVVERRDGERVYKEYPANYIFYYDDPRGKFQSIYGTPVNNGGGGLVGWSHSVSDFFLRAINYK